MRHELDDAGDELLVLPGEAVMCAEATGIGLVDLPSAHPLDLDAPARPGLERGDAGWPRQATAILAMMQRERARQPVRRPQDALDGGTAGPGRLAQEARGQDEPVRHGALHDALGGTMRAHAGSDHDDRTFQRRHMIDRGREVRAELGEQHVVALGGEGVPVADQDIVGGLAEARPAADLEPAITAGQQGVRAVTADGEVVFLRPLVPDDRDAVLRLHEGLDERDRYYRFFGPVPGRLVDLVLNMISPVGARRGSIGAFRGSELIGVGHYDGLAEPAGEQTGELREFGQSRYVDRGALASMAESGFVYVPRDCAAGARCRVHVAFHGCRQGIGFIGRSFARQAGYNRWADANRIVVLYPQVKKSLVWPMNPRGCWDWWGYSGPDYAARSGAQLSAVRRMLSALGAT